MANMRGPGVYDFLSVDLHVDLIASNFSCGALKVFAIGLMKVMFAHTYLAVL